MAASTSLDWHATDVDVPTIQKQLTGLWTEINHDSKYPGAVRTSIFDLVVFTRGANQAERVCATLDRLSGRQPSRVTILVADRGARGATIDGSINIECLPTPSGSTLCHERLVITAHGRAADHLPSVVVPLLIPEIPTYLWWPEQPPFGHRMFHRLLSVADQLVVDSSKFASPGDALADIARLCSGRQGVNDFHWARLTPWREIIAQFFDGPLWAPYARGVVSVRVGFARGPDLTSATAETLLLLGWVSSQLHWEPETTAETVFTGDVAFSVLQGEKLIPIDIHFQDLKTQLAGRLVSVEIVSHPKGMAPARFIVERTSDVHNANVTMEVHDGPQIRRVVPIDVKDDARLLTEELAMVGHDSAYGVVVNMASRLAGREVWVPV
jgi:glucose-6-phosphate dehydrogenase assembly protein OpcA